jgi:hypothetical protein
MREPRNEEGTADRAARIRRLEWQAQAATYRRRLAEWQLLGMIWGALAALVIVLVFSVSSDWLALSVAVVCQIVGQSVAGWICVKRQATNLRKDRARV